MLKYVLSWFFPWKLFLVDYRKGLSTSTGNLMEQTWSFYTIGGHQPVGTS